ncbi:MAG: PHB depolymerase family esterase [Gemmatimonadaceae bacterium]
MTGAAARVRSATIIRSRKVVLAAVLGLIGLPVMLALTEAVYYHVRNRSNGSIVSSGLRREYLLYVPRSYDRTRPTPLVISMHGGAMWPAAQKETSQWNRVADEHGFIVVYPSGVSGRGPRAWRAGSSGPGMMRDVRFISELIDTLRSSYNIDLTRVYANGLSNGGGMAFVLSCALSDRIAAVGMVAAAHLLPWSWCTDHRPVPMISFHGTADHFTPYDGGQKWIAPRPFPSIRTWTANWAEGNRCAPHTNDSVVAADVTRRTYTNCAGDASVVLYTIRGGGHTWPGGGSLPEWMLGPTNRNIDATGQMWAFFREHHAAGKLQSRRR